MAMNVVHQVTDLAKDAFVALSSCFCPTDSTLKLNGRAFKVVKLLGEGGFSYVYLAEDNTSGRIFALKKIRCPLGSDSVRAAMKEVEAYRRFRHPNIIRCLDSCVVQDPDDPDCKIIYLFLPYYRRGNLQNMMTANSVNGTRFSEKEMLSLFLGTLFAVRAMHTYVAGPSASYPPSSIDGPSNMSIPESKGQSRIDAGLASLNRKVQHHGHGDDDDEDDDPASDGASGYAPLMSGADATKSDIHLEEVEGARDEAGTGNGDARDPQPDPNTSTNGDANAEEGKMQPWRHGDIKPANVMVADDGSTPILMDFGSACPARIPIPTRSAALVQQDVAAEHCTMPFRAPELFDVKTGVDLDEKVDIWSLGCTLYAIAYGYSPFETPQHVDQGASVAMTVQSGNYKFPAGDNTYSQNFKDLIGTMLVLDPKKRPDIHQLIELTEKALARLS